MVGLRPYPPRDPAPDRELGKRANWAWGSQPELGHFIAPQPQATCRSSRLDLKMSGFEVAAVILGAFPILISALEGYRDFARRVGLWYNIRQEYQKCRNEVNAERVASIGNPRRLLLHLAAVDDARMTRLLTDPSGEDWRDADLARHLQDHLQDWYDVFLDTIEDMKRDIGELKKELMVDADNLRRKIEETKIIARLVTRLKDVFKKPSATKGYQLYRLQFSLGKRTRESLFQELQHYNNRLQQRLETGDAVSHTQSARNTASELLSGLSPPDSRSTPTGSALCSPMLGTAVVGSNTTSISSKTGLLPSRIYISCSGRVHPTRYPILILGFANRHPVEVVKGLGEIAQGRGPGGNRKEQASRIPSLCATLRCEPPFPASRHSYLLGRNERYYIYPTDISGMTISPENTTAITLESILGGGTPASANTNTPSTIFTRRDRRLVIHPVGRNAVDQITLANRT
ncbi:hypothetical protein DL763_005206 [Monosporascus cannonballus]|nr:hypothetical protein DL763_005206 [Monosporascus cannonballus]